MSNRRGGLIEWIVRRPGQSLGTAGFVLFMVSLVNLAIVRLADPGSRFIRRGLLGWPSIGSIPLPFIMLAGIIGLATATTMLIVAAYLRGPPTKSRLAGCALIGIGTIAVGVGLYVSHDPVPWQGLSFMGMGGFLLKRSAKSPPPPVPG